jgi:hypothetical protein
MEDAYCPLLFQRELYMESNSKNPSVKIYYKDCFKIPTKVTERAKRLEYEKQILKSCNKIKTTWRLQILNRVEI